MSSLVDKIEKLDNLVRPLQRIESRLYLGHQPDAYREINRLIAHMEKEEKESPDDGMKNQIRQLRKIGSKVYMGQVVPACRELGQLIALLNKTKMKIIEEADNAK